MARAIPDGSGTAQTGLAQVLEKEITAAYLSGKTNRPLRRRSRDRFSAAYRDAERLVRTEASYVANRAAVEEYAQAGCRYVEFLTAKDSRTCPICAGHDGDIVPIEKAKTGSNIPPLHPNCRCTVLPVVEDEPENELQDSGKNDTMPLDGESATVEHPPIRSPIEQRSTAKGNPNAILIWGQPLNNRQMRILERLPEYDARMTVRKRNVSMRDLAALTAETGCEYAMFTKGAGETNHSGECADDECDPEYGAGNGGRRMALERTYTSRGYKSASDLFGWRYRCAESLWTAAQRDL